jgi:hypothetical protein
MRSIKLRISPELKRLADSYYERWEVDLNREYFHLRFKDINSALKRKGEVGEFFKLHTEWLAKKVHARVSTYLDAFARQNVIPDEADLSDMSWAVDAVISSHVSSLPAQLKEFIEEIGKELIKDARRDIRIFIQEMMLESRNPPAQASATHINTINIQGDHLGTIQQGGEGNTQKLENRSEDET